MKILEGIEAIVSPSTRDSLLWCVRRLLKLPSDVVFRRGDCLSLTTGESLGHGLLSCLTVNSCMAGSNLIELCNQTNQFISRDKLTTPLPTWHTSIQHLLRKGRVTSLR